MSNLEKRFALQAARGLGESGYNERESHKKAAALILQDYPFGVGPNHFTFIANAEGYYDKAGLATRDVGARNNRVHSVYWLTAAESGYLGLVSLATLLLSVIFTAFWKTLQTKDNRKQNLFIGFGTSILVFSAHSIYEWIFVSSTVQYFFAMSVGIICCVLLEPNKYRPHKTRSVSPNGKMII